MGPSLSPVDSSTVSGLLPLSEAISIECFCLSMGPSHVPGSSPARAREVEDRLSTEVPLPGCQPAPGTPPSLALTFDKAMSLNSEAV